jgi:Porin subfamily
LKVGGNVWVEGQWVQPVTKAQDTIGTRTQLRITLDARTNTEYGLLRTVIDPRINKRNGQELSATQPREGNAFIGSNTEGTSKQTHINSTAYIQFGGLTVGRLTSFAGAQFSNNDLIGVVGIDARDEVNTIAYTASLGNGITLTGALEDGTDANRDGVFSMYNGSAYKAAVAPTFTPGTGALASSGSAAVGSAVTYGGSRIPDAVLAFKIDQSWGSANLAAVSHAINYSSAQFSTEYGYGLSGALKVNLPMIAAGDSFLVQGAYASGFNAFTMRNSTGDKTSQNNNGAQYIGGMYQTATINDVVVDTGTGKTYLATSYGGNAEFTHYFTPTVAAFIGGSYSKVTWDSAAQTVTANINPFQTYSAYLGAIWSPVAGLKIVPEVYYAKVTTKYATVSTSEVSGKNQDAWQARIQIRRDF